MTFLYPLELRRRPFFCFQAGPRVVSGRLFAIFLLLLASVSSQAQSRLDEEDDEDAPKTWQEVAPELPAAPKPENLLPFDAGNGTQSFFIDAPSVSVGSDNVVRYTLVAKSSGGATNVSYEGIRCASYEHKLYAFGRPDGSWSQARRSQWQRISNSLTNQQHIALAKDYFCRQLTVAGKAKEMVARLRDKQPLSNESYR